MSLPPSQADYALDSPPLDHDYQGSFADHEGEGPSFISDIPSATSDDAHSEPDSLADASAEEVEARALAFLNQPQSSSTHITSLNKLSQASLAQAGAIDPFTLPRKPPTSDVAKQDAHADALAFLRRCLAAVDETSWQFHTPAPFDPPQALGPKARREETDGLAGQDEGWADSAFNLASYPTPAGAEVGEQLLEQAVDEGEWDAEDGEVPEGVTMEESGFGFGEGAGEGYDDVRVGTGLGGGATSWGVHGHLERRVSQLGMK